ncbi:MAG: prepilin-type N-terminal cleavage/methylation domain-containing protein [Chthoniobacterales bacterium]|nr:prepilin-type N-terminal cleavage/methylation domain-containing protein [Chthoniobacterales bacterium]
MEPRKLVRRHCGVASRSRVSRRRRRDSPCQRRQRGPLQQPIRILLHGRRLDDDGLRADGKIPRHQIAFALFAAARVLQLRPEREPLGSSLRIDELAGAVERIHVAHLLHAAGRCAGRSLHRILRDLHRQPGVHDGDRVCRLHLISLGGDDGRQLHPGHGDLQLDCRSGAGDQRIGCLRPPSGRRLAHRVAQARNMKSRLLHPQQPLDTGFTLVELLVVMAIIAVLAAVAIAASGSAVAKSAAAECATNLRSLGAGLQLYCADHGGSFPRSYHSAGASREPGWAASIAPYLGTPEATATEDWKTLFNSFFRCPADKNSDPRVYSYGLNVFFELDPDGDDYVGAPASWRRTVAIPNPSRTIMLAEVASASGGMTADHFMCHQWSSVNAAKNAVAHERHSGKSNFLFVDGHVETLPIADTFTSKTHNRWNPSTAGN